MPATVVSRIPEVLLTTEARCAIAVEKAVFDIEARAKAHLRETGAIDTGELLNSVQGQLNSPHSGEVSTSVEYAVFVEYGTGQRGASSGFEGKPEGISYTQSWPGMSARPYLTPAVEEAGPAFYAEVAEVFR